MGKKSLRERYDDIASSWGENDIRHKLLSLADEYGRGESVTDFASWLGISDTLVSKYFRAGRKVSRDALIKMHTEERYPQISRESLDELLEIANYNPFNEQDRKIFPQKSKATFAQKQIHARQWEDVENFLETINGFVVRILESPIEIDLKELKRSGCPELTNNELLAIAKEYPSQFKFSAEQKKITLHDSFSKNQIQFLVKKLTGNKVKRKANAAINFRTGIESLDKLFFGGIKLPPGDQGVTILLVGSPGGGKTTLSMVLANSWAQMGNFSFFFALEQDITSLNRTAEAFNLTNSGAAWQFGRHSKKRTHSKQVLVTDLPPTSRQFDSRINALASALKKSPAKNKLVVIDSLDVFTTSDIKRDDFFRLKRLLDRNCRLSIIILEKALSSLKRHRLEESVADIVIELSSINTDYFLRTIEIKKARTQFHALGKHRVKIKGSTNSIGNDPSEIQVFPSLHYHLSIAQRSKKNQKNYNLKFGHPSLDSYIGGVVSDSATILIGEPGSGKKETSLSFLVEGAKNKEKTLLVSFKGESPTELNQALETMKVANLKILNKYMTLASFRPGFITPDEFIDKILNIIKPNGDLANFTRIVIDDEAQLATRFPLLAKDEMFLPTLIDIFKSYGLTSVFIVVTGQGSDSRRNQALLTISDNAIKFERDDDNIHVNVIKTTGYLGSLKPFKL